MTTLTPALPKAKPKCTTRSVPATATSTTAASANGGGRQEKLPQRHCKGQGGPDAGIIDSNNLSTHLDYSGYNHFTQEHIKRALAQTTLSDRTWTTALAHGNDQTPRTKHLLLLSDQHLHLLLSGPTHVWTTSLPTKRTLSPTVMPPR
jgi:hypothetical protein